MKTLLIIATLIASFQFVVLPLVSASEDAANVMQEQINSRDAAIQKALSE